MAVRARCARRARRTAFDPLSDPRARTPRGVRTSHNVAVLSLTTRTHTPSTTRPWSCDLRLCDADSHRNFDARPRSARARGSLSGLKAVRRAQRAHRARLAPKSSPWPKKERQKRKVVFRICLKVCYLNWSGTVRELCGRRHLRHRLERGA